jgi:hypothetical protein
MCKNAVEWTKPQTTIWRKRIACWIPRATNTHSEFVILIPFPLQQWLHKRTSTLRYTYIVSLVIQRILNLEFKRLKPANSVTTVRTQIYQRMRGRRMTKMSLERQINPMENNVLICV